MGLTFKYDAEFCHFVGLFILILIFLIFLIFFS